MCVASVNPFFTGAISTFKISSLASTYPEACMSLDPILFITRNLPDACSQGGSTKEKLRKQLFCYSSIFIVYSVVGQDQNRLLCSSLTKLQKKILLSSKIGKQKD